MHTSITRALSAAGVTAALLAGSFAIAPAANAITPKVSAGYTSSNETIKVGSHKDKLSIKKASTEVVYLGKKDGVRTYAPAAYTLKLTNAKGHVLYTHKVSTWQGLNAFVGAPAHTYKTDTALTKQVKHDSRLSTAAAKKAEQLLEKKLNAEFGLGFTLAFEAAIVNAWVAQNPAETTFDAFYSQSAEYAQLKTVLSGTPRDYTLASKDSGTGIGLSIRVVNNDLQHATITWTGSPVFGTFKIGNGTITVGRK